MMKVCAAGVQRDFLRKGSGTNILTAVQACDLCLAPGELAVIFGRSGSGKTTLLNMLAGLLLPTAGKVTYEENDIYRMSDEALSRFRNQHIGFIPQGQSAISSLTVRENILLPFALYGEAGEAKARADELLRRLGIETLADAMPRELSGGELRRMAVARALAKAPEVLFADEPTGDLDDANTEVVFQILKQTAGSGAAVLMVTHEADAAGYADALYRMDAGVLRRE